MEKNAGLRNVTPDVQLMACAQMEHVSAQMDGMVNIVPLKDVQGIAMDMEHAQCQPIKWIGNVFAVLGGMDLVVKLSLNRSAMIKETMTMVSTQFD